MSTSEAVKPSHFQVLVGFYVEAETEREAIEKVAAIIPEKMVAEHTDYPEAWTAKPWDMEGRGR